MKIIHTDGGPIFIYLVEGELAYISALATPETLKIECENGHLISSEAKV